MKAMLFCAGIGSRLSPITDLVPKPMVDFFGCPLVDYTLSQLEGWGITELVVNLHHRPEVLRQRLESRWGNAFNLHLSEEEYLLGTGGGLKEVERLFRGLTSLVANGDIILDLSVDIEQMLEMHYKNCAAATLLLTESKTDKYTPIQVDEKGRISMLGSLFGGHNPDRPRYAYCGLQILEPAIFRFIPPGKPSSVITAVVEMLRSGLSVRGFILDGYWRELGDLDGYKEAHWDVLDGKSPYRAVVEESERFAFIQDRHESFDLNDFGIAFGTGVGIEPPVALGRSCTIGKDTHVGPYAVIGESVRIGEQAEVTRSVLWRGARVPHGARLRETIIYQ